VQVARQCESRVAVLSRGTGAVVNALVVIGVCVLAGCNSGGGAKRLDKHDYLSALRAIEASDPARRASRLFFEVVADPPLPQRSCRVRTNELHDALGKIVGRVERLRPPAEVAQLQRRFVAAARDSVRAVGRAAGDVAAGKLRCGRLLNRRIYGLRSTARAQAVLGELAKRGYTLGLNAPD
jgi:hypothetical protein